LPGRRPVTLAGAAMNPADLDSIPLFAKLSPDERARIAAAARPVHFATGEVIVNRGEFSFDFYAITGGAAEVRQDERRVAELGAGDVLGEMGVLPAGSGSRDRRRGATVTVTEPTDALAIDGRELRRLTDEIPALAGALRTLVAERARALGQA
jgi:CRP/FNR family transcriptional regulator, cyclic AMP receptor protein